MNTRPFHPANYYAVLLLLLAGFFLAMSTVSAKADEIATRLVWQEEAGSIVRGYYLRDGDGDPRFEHFQRHATDVESEFNNFVDAEEEILPNRPGEAMVVISNNIEQPLNGSWATVYLPHSERYMVRSENGSVQFVDELSSDPADAERQHWFLGQIYALPSISLCADDACDNILYGDVHLGVDSWDWERRKVHVFDPPEVTYSGSTSRTIRSYIEPLPEGIGIAPKLIGLEDEYAMEMVRRAGFEPEFVSMGTHTSENLKRVVGQEPDPWVALAPGSTVQVGVASEISLCAVPNVLGKFYQQGVEQLEAVGLSVQVVYQQTDDEAQWSRVMSIYYPRESANLFAEEIAHLMHGDEVVIPKNEYLEIHVGVSGDDGDASHLTAMGVSFLAPNGSNYITASPSSHAVSATASAPRGWEQFIIESPSKDQPLSSGNLVFVLSSHGLYLSAAKDGTLTASAEELDPLCAFHLIKIGGRIGDAIHYGDQIVLRSIHGKYVSSSDKGGSSVKANGPRVGGWEPLKLVQPPLKKMKVALRTGNGVNYLTLSGSNNENVHANVEQIRSWEQFTVTSADGEPIRDGSTVTIETHFEAHFEARSNGLLRSNGSSDSDEAQWVVEKLGGSPGDLISYGDDIALLGAHGRYIQAVDAGGGEVKAMGSQGELSQRETLTLIHPR